MTDPWEMLRLTALTLVKAGPSETERVEREFSPTLGDYRPPGQTDENES